MNDPSINQLGELDEVDGDATDQTTRFRDWLRANGWTVNTEHRGPMRIGGRTGRQDKSVAAFELMLLDELYELALPVLAGRRRFTPDSALASGPP